MTKTELKNKIKEVCNDVEKRMSKNQLEYQEEKSRIWHEKQELLMALATAKEQYLRYYNDQYAKIVDDYATRIRTLVDNLERMQDTLHEEGQRRIAELEAESAEQEKGGCA